VLVLSTDGSRIYRYDSVKATLVALPEVGATGVSPHAPAGVFLEPRRFRGASNIAAIDGTLYVADPNAHRVQVFELTTLALIRIHDGIADPADVAAAPQGVFILDRATGRVLRTSSASDEVTVRRPRAEARHDVGSHRHRSRRPDLPARSPCRSAGAPRVQDHGRR
jgi:hypothetical protein